ncbi:MAG: acyltransferase family protein [Caulobacter sp.]|nr:acyltransferase family protein [Caulobacter sp.]
MKYRAEIDGLRAVAVLPVILFHAGFPLFHGGFIGVDVFFVISGYLITGIITPELSRGEFSILRFYERRVRRILPALLLVAALCIPFAWMWMLPAELKDFSQSLAAVMLFVSNILFWKEEGYFSAAAELKPLLHTWSLAVEEQFYVFFPPLLMVLWRWGRSRTFWTLLGFAALSLALSEWAWRHEPSANFYLAPTRAWELLAGSLAALWQADRGARSSNSLSLAGLAAIVLSMALYGESTPFPSAWGLLPVLGVVLVILFAGPGTWVAWLLSRRVFVGIGLVSYSAYLWHQPLFAFARIRGVVEPSQAVMIGLTLATFVLAWLSWRFVESPFRKGPASLLPKRRSLFLAAGATGAVLVALGVAGSLAQGFEGRFNPKSGDPALLALAATTAPQTLSKGCFKGIPEPERIGVFCGVFQPPNPVSTIAIFGDSHANAILPAFTRVGRESTVWQSALGGCPPLLDVYVIAGNYDVDVCPRLTAHQLTFVRENHIDVVVLVGRWSLYTYGNKGGNASGYLLSDQPNPLSVNIESSRAVFLRAMASTVKQYRAAGARVVLVDQIPQQSVDPKLIIERMILLGETGGAEQIIRGTSTETAEDDLVQGFASRALTRLAGDGVSVLNMDRTFLSEGRYLWARPAEVYYFDFNHLSKLGALKLQDQVYAATRSMARP